MPILDFGKIQVALANYLESLALYNAYTPNHPDLAQVYKNIGLICEEVEHDYSLALSF
jgi:hypothetical protein